MPRHYTADDKMTTLIAEDYPLIQVMTRFGIRMGFGDHTVKEVCEEAGVDCATFLAVVNFVVEGFTTPDTENKLSIKSLMHYLKQSHVYFLDYCLPMIRRKLLDGIRLNTSDVSVLMIKFFDEYYREVKTHMDYEERTVFSYIDTLLSGRYPENFRIATYSEHHEKVSDRLGELKNIIIKYCPDSADSNLLNDALYSIYRCERELENHCKVEDYLLVPEIMRLEKEVKASGDSQEDLSQPDAGVTESSHSEEADDNREPLSNREKEIIANVAKGLTNKEIADKLFISVHTVITHRRNIARKLEIHSATGLTIYAIVNKLVDISDLHL